MSDLHRQQLADSLLPSMHSTLKWTPYFWQQARYGMLWPLLCSWIHHPLLNMLAIMFITVTFGLMAHFLLARFLWRGRGPWAWTGLTSIVATLALGSDRFIFETLSPLQFMTTPLVFGLCSLQLLERGAPGLLRKTLAAILLALMAWYNPAACVLLGALVFWSGGLPLLFGCVVAKEAVPRRFWIQWFSEITAVGTAIGGGAWMMRHAHYHNPVFDQGLTFELWMQTARTLFASMFTPSGDDMGAPYLASAACLAVVVISSVIAMLRRPALMRAWRQALASLLAAVSYGLVVSQRAWARQENCNARYFFPVLFVATSVASLLLVALWQTGKTKSAEKDFFDVSSRVGRLAGAGTLMVAFALTGARFGLPSYSGVERWLTKWTGQIGDELMATKCTHVAGRYWDAWPAAFYVQWKRYLSGDTTPMYAISNWAAPTSELWPVDRSTWRIGVLRASTQDALFYARRYGLPDFQVENTTAHLLVTTLKSSRDVTER